jgi:outer membrane protein assembly factor BamD (BamD/ComL family)
MDPEGEERWRLEGYLSKDEFEAHLKMGLARVAFMKKDWADAERRYAEVAEKYPDSAYAPEAVYYQGVSRYSASHDGAELAAVAKTFDEKYRDSEWAMRSRPWSSH